MAAAADFEVPDLTEPRIFEAYFQIYLYLRDYYSLLKPEATRRTLTQLFGPFGQTGDYQMQQLLTPPHHQAYRDALLAQMWRQIQRQPNECLMFTLDPGHDPVSGEVIFIGGARHRQLAIECDQVPPAMGQDPFSYRWHGGGFLPFWYPPEPLRRLQTVTPPQIPIQLPADYLREVDHYLRRLPDFAVEAVMMQSRDVRILDYTPPAGGFISPATWSNWRQQILSRPENSTGVYLLWRQANRALLGIVELDPLVQYHVWNLQELILGAPPAPQPLTLYRGAEHRGLEMGEEVTFLFFVATSLNLDIAADYAGEDGVVYHLLVPAGHPLIWEPGLSQFILPYGSRGWVTQLGDQLCQITISWP